MNQDQFIGKIALITGAGSGIGRETALEFARRGAITVLTDLRLEPLKETEARILQGGPKPFLYVADIQREDEVKKLFNEIDHHFKRLDHAFNNAGIDGMRADLSDQSQENWDRVIDTNLKGTWLCMKYEIKQMLLQGDGGTIVNCASIAGNIGFEGMAPYVASKHGIVGLTKTAAIENARRKIRVNSVSPGVIETPMVSNYLKNHPENRKDLVLQEPMGRLGLPAEIASGVLWLSSKESSFVTGEDLIIDGGWLAG